MDPQDIVWRLLNRLADDRQILEESYQLVDSKKNKDLQHAISECEQLVKTQENILNRIRRRYEG